MPRYVTVTLWILLDLAVILVITLIELFLRQDKRRFIVERYFSTYKDLFDDWMTQAGDIPACSRAVSDYFGTRKNWRKLECVAACAELSDGLQTEAMAKIARKLSSFYKDYESRVRKYNKLMAYPLIKKTLRLMGFRELPEFRLAKHREKAEDGDPS